MAQEDEGGGGERTEPATPRRIEKARQEGQVALSKEAVGFAALLASALAAIMLLPVQVRELAAAMRGLLGRAHELQAERAAADWAGLFLDLAWPVAGAAGLAAVAVTLLQTRGAISAKSLVPKLSKISPLTGAKRLLGVDGLLEFLRTLAKMLIVMAALWFVARDLPDVAPLLEAPPAEVFARAGDGVLRLLLATLVAFAFLAGVDVLITRHRHLQKLRMSRQELKEEQKESEGDPAIRGRLRQLREQRGRQRMMAAIPRAAVVVTNPTHYAVALEYNPGQSAAPKLVAKGVDVMAARIREKAREAGVPIVSDPPLARALHRLDLDTEIPAEHWDAVARIIAFVMRARGPL